MKNKISTLKTALACVAIGWMCWSATNFCQAQTQPANPSGLSPDLQEVVKLSQEQMTDDVITNYIKNSGKTYTLTTDDLIYLKDQGVSQGVISALEQTASSNVISAGQTSSTNIPTATPVPTQTSVTPTPAASTSPVPTPSPAPVQTVTLPAPSAAPQNNLVQEYDDYVFEIKECKLEDREDKQLNDGKPHKQLICKVLVTNKAGDRTLNMHGNVEGARIRTIDDMGTEYDISGGTLGTSQLSCYAFAWPDGANAALVLPSGVPVKAVLIFGMKDGIGYFSPNAQSLGVLDVGFISKDTSGNKPFHIQFKNVPIPLVEAPPAPVAVAPAPPAPSPTPSPDNGSTPTADTTQPPVAQAVNFDYFHDQLAPFGTWIQVAGYGPCWRPDAAIKLNPDFRPYYDNGQWVYTDNGWFWQSDYTWGDIPFHYGNWIIDPTYGWLWVPGYTWGPAWVFWRQAEADGYIGWAPLPPGAVFVNGGWDFRGHHYGVDFDFGLGEACFAFIGYDHVHDNFFRMRGREFAFHVSRERIHAFYGRTVLRNDFRRDEHGRLINDGIGRDRIEQLTHHQVEAAHFEERNPVGDRNKLATQRIEEAHKQVGPPIGKPGEPGHELPGKPMEQPVAPAPVNKVFRPQVQMPKPTAILPKPAQAPQQALKNNKPQH